MQTILSDKLNVVLDEIPARVAYVDAEGNHQFHNRAFLEWTGLDDHGIRGKHMSGVFGSETFAELKPHFDKVLAGETCKFEMRLSPAAGGEIDADVSLVPHFDARGGAVGCLIFFLDSVGIQRANSTEAMLAVALQSVSDAVSLYDSDDRLLFSNLSHWRQNREVERVFRPGTSFEEIARCIGDFYFGEEGQEKADEYVRQRIELFRNPTGPVETNLGERWVRTNHYRTDDNGTISIYTDVSDLKRRELELARIEERHELATRAAGVGVWDWNLDTGEFYHDAAIKALIGYADDEIANQYEVWLELVHPEDRERVASAAADHADGRALEFIVEHRKVHKDGSDRWFLTRGKLVGGSDRSPRRMIGTEVDMTDLKRTEIALQESEERYRTLVVLSPDAVIVQRDGKFVYVNPAAVRFFGARDASEILGQETLQFIHPEHRTAIVERRAVHSGLGIFRDFQQLRFLLPDGSERVGEGRVGAISWDGLPASLAIIRDVTVRERMTRDLRESEERYRNLVELMPDAVMVSNEDHVLFANTGAARLHGIDLPEDMVGHKYLDLVHPESREASDFRRREILRTGRYLGPIDQLHLRVDTGESVFVEKLGRRILWRGKPAVLGMVRDISERRRMEGALRESEEFLRLITDSLPILVCYLGEDGRYRFVNKQYEEWFGLPRSEIIGWLAWDFVISRVEVEDKQQAREAIRTNVQKALSGEPVYYEASRTYNDGQKRYVRNVLVPHFGDGPRPIGAFVLVFDITEVMEREEQILAARDAAEHANQSKSRFLASASHDLRQPLQALNLLTYVLSGKEVAPENRSLIRDMQHALSAMESVLNGLIDISKLEAGVVVPEIEDFPLEDLFEQMRSSFSLQAQEKGLNLRIRPTAAAVRSDPNQLARILENLVSNAIRYTGEGGIVVGCRRRRGKAWIEVWDTGAGIPPNQIEKVFEEFYQLQNPARDRHKGMGLGLAIVHRTAHLLNHKVDVRSRLGRGSKFSVCVPLTEVSQYVSELPQPIDGDYDITGSNILVIEDDLSVLDATRRLLEGWGADVAAAPSADDALEKIADDDFLPDLVIADYSLPHRETGTQAVEILRAALGYDVSGIIITGDTAPDRVKEARAAGFHVLHKPVDARELRQLIGAMLHGAGTA